MFTSTDLSVQKNPLPFLDWMRQQSPVYHDPATGVYYVTRDCDIRQVAMDTDSFSNVVDPGVFRIIHGHGLERSDPEVATMLKTKGWLLPTTLLFTDPPENARYRRLAREALGPAPVKQLAGHIRERVDHLLDQFPDGQQLEFVAEFAKRLPIWVIGRFIFGAPEQDFQQINDWADQFFSTLMPAAPREDYLQSVNCMIDMHHSIKRRIDYYRQSPDDNVLLSRLISVHKSTGDVPLSDEEMMSMMHVMLLAGHDTTRQTLSSCLMELARQPELMQRLKNEPSLITRFIEEVLRLHPAANVTSRICVKEAVISGITIPANSMVFIAWGSGNRDDTVRNHALDFDIDRKDSVNHLSFGWGLHHCAGIHLARAQLTIAMEQILKRFSSIELCIAEDELDYAPSMNTRSLLSLPLKFTL